MLTLSATAAFSTPILSASHSIVYREWCILLPKLFSHCWTQYYCLISGRHHLPEFCSASRWYFSILSHLFSVVAMVIQMKCPPFQLTSRSAFDILPIPIDVSLNYSLSHPQIQLALQTWPLALLSAYFGCICLLCFKTSLCLHCLMLSWSGLSWTRTTTSGLEEGRLFSCPMCPHLPGGI